MRLPIRFVRLAGIAVLVAACGAGAASPSSEPDAGGSTSWLRMQTTQAIPPVNVFAVGPTAVITADGTWVTTLAQPEVYPGPLLPSLMGRSLSDAGREAIMAEADRLGLIGPKRDFRGTGAMPGGVTGQLQLTIDGRPVTLTGEPDSQLLCVTTPCEPLPGTPEAFGQFWRELLDPSPWLGAELGPASPFVADAYAILVGPPPTPDPALGARIQDWPLDVPLATFGGPVANGTHRCGIVSGADAETLRPALRDADQLTQWVQDESTSATFGLTVRAIIAGEDPCADAFGPA